MTSGGGSGGRRLSPPRNLGGPGCSGEPFLRFPGFVELWGVWRGTECQHHSKWESHLRSPEVPGSSQAPRIAFVSHQEAPTGRGMRIGVPEGLGE